MRALVLFGGLTGLIGCSDAGLKTVNTAPSATITSHISGDVVGSDMIFTIVGVVSDVDDPTDKLEASWMVGTLTMCGAAAPNDEGLNSCKMNLPVGEAVVTLIVRDPKGATGSAQVKLHSAPPLGDDTGEPPDDTGEPDDTGDPPTNLAPSCAITAPLDGAVFPAGVAVTLQGEVEDEEDGPGALSISWTSDLDGILSVAGADTAGSVSMSTDAMSVGTHTINLSATDTDGSTCTDDVSLSINGQPTAPEVVIEPGPAFTEDDLTAVVVIPSTDPEGDPVSYTFAWSVDGAPVAITDTTVPSSDTERGQIWAVRVTPSDGLAAGPVGETTREISNTPPQVDAVSLSPSPAYTDDTISATATGSDADGDPVSLTYTWTVNGITVAETGTSLSGAVHFDKGDEVGLTVTPGDPDEDGDPVSATPVSIENSPPTAPGISISPEDPVEGIDAVACLIETDATDADDDLISYTTTWTVDGVAAGGAPGPLDIHEGEVWTCTVTPNDGEEDGASASVSVTISGLPVLQSCLEILEAGVSTGDGDYEIEPPCGGLTTVWCDMSTDGGGWTTITELDFSLDVCPDDWLEESGLDLCSRDPGVGMISSADFDNRCISYAEVLGNLTAIQYGSTDAFGDSPPHDIDSAYGDVISLTVGEAGSRSHIFTYSFGYRLDLSDDSNCPHHPGGASPASFVGSDYLCDTANDTPGGPVRGWYSEVPLFEEDWWQVSLGFETNESVEGRLMCTHGRSDEDVGVERITLRVR